MEEIKMEDGIHRRRRMAREKKKEQKKQGPVICLFLEHGSKDMAYSVYLMKPYLEDFESTISDVFHVADESMFLTRSTSVTLGSKMYFFGGFNNTNGVVDVHVFDTDNPNLGFQSVASLNAPKELPCVFVADGMIYALGCPIDRVKRFHHASGCFERYLPTSNTWQVLPDPPANLDMESAVTVVGRRVFIAPCCIVFNLDTLEWDPVIPFTLASRFPFGSIYAQNQNSLYYLRGEDTCDLFEYLQPQRFEYGEPPKVAKRGPLPSPLPPHNHQFLKAPCFDPPMEHIVAPPYDLTDPNIFFDHDCFEPWRRLFHMGGRFFCYVVTAQIFDWDSNTICKPHSRGVWIKFFEEVEVPSQEFQFKTEFRTLASFCYEIKTKFKNHADWIRGSVIGSVPRSWIKNPPGNMVHKSALLRDHSSKVEIVREEDPTKIDNLQKLIAGKDEEIRRLVAEVEALKAKGA